MSGLPITQYWMQTPVDPDVGKLIADWQAYGKDRHTLYSDQDAEAFIARHFTDREVAAYRACKIPAMRADYFRLCALDAVGGMYVDADIKLRVEGVETLAEGKGLLFIRKGNVANDLVVASEPNTALMRYAREKATKNIEERIHGLVWKVTGPGILTALYEEDVSAFADWRVVPIEDVRPYVRFVAKRRLSYKSTHDHWVGQKDIYVDGPPRTGEKAGAGKAKKFVPRRRGRDNAAARAVLHIGFHKTGTTSFQHLMRQVTLSAERPGEFWFSSQHAPPDEEWRKVRLRHWRRIRDTVALFAAHRPLEDQNGLDADGIANYRRHRNLLRNYFNRAERIIVHSDENTLGHPLFRRTDDEAKIPLTFYPGAERMIDELSSVVAETLHAPEIVLTIRDFVGLVVSSLKMAAAEGIDLSDMDGLLGACNTIEPRLKAIVSHALAAESVSAVRVVDMDLAKADFRAFALAITGPVSDSFSQNPAFDENWHSNPSGKRREKRVQKALGLDDSGDGDALSVLPDEFVAGQARAYQSMLAWLEATAADNSKLTLHRADDVREPPQAKTG